MPKRQVFYSFHYANDVMRAQLVRNIGAIEGNAPVAPNEWEEVKRQGDEAVKRWIDANMKYRSCVVVLVGEATAFRPWVNYEIVKGWNDGKGVVGIHIHNLSCPRNGTSAIGQNPFDFVTLNGGRLSRVVKCYNPPANNAYGWISTYIDACAEEAIKIREAAK